MLILGSHALRIRAPHLLNRTPSDVDLFASMDEINSFARKSRFKTARPTEAGRKYVLSDGHTIYDVEIAWSDTLAAQLIDLVAADPDTIVVSPDYLNGFSAMVPSLAVLAALKATHKYLKNSPHFLKTMRDNQMYAAQDLTLKEQYKDWFKARTKETYAYSHPKLNQSKHNFFTDEVKYTYDHDTIHIAVKQFDHPAYSYFQQDEAEVAVSKDKFLALSEDIKLASVVEESCVLAIERSLVPFPGAKTTEEAFLFALEKVCTSITSGWWRAYAYDNYDNAIKLFLNKYQDYFEKFQVALSAGIVQPFRGGH